MQNGGSMTWARAGIVWGRWLPLVWLAVAGLTAQAEISGDYTYTVNPNGTVRIDSYSGSAGALAIPSTLDTRPVVGLGYAAFAGCATLTGVTLPDSVAYIEDYVFKDCTGLVSVAIGSGIDSIGFGVFDYCSSLTSITVNAGSAAYSSLDGVLFNQDQTTLVLCPDGRAGGYTVPTGVTSIGDYAFDSCDSLTNVAIPGGVTGIGKQAFWGCTNLAGMVIPDSVAVIGNDAFNYCLRLASVAIGSGVASLGDFAFYECASLTGVTIPAGLTNIGEMAFSRCARLAAITVAAGNPAYSSLAGVLFNQDRTVLVQCPGGKSGRYTVPAGVTNIGGVAYAPWPANGLGGFSWCTNLTGVTLPAGVASIGKNAFIFCSSLAGITLPDSVTEIGYQAFEGCAGLANIIIPAGVSRIAYWAFAGCTGLRNVTMAEGIAGIEAQAFTGCAGLTGMTLPHSVTNIGMGAFSGCTNLGWVTVGRGVAAIGDVAFGGCSSLTGAFFWGNAPAVGVNAFTNAGNATVYYLAGSMGWGPTFGGRPTALWNPPPAAATKANGLAHAVNVSYPAPVSVTVELYAGAYAGVNVDWWVAVFADSGECFYLNNARQWIPFNGDLAACRPVYQGALGNLPAIAVLDGFTLSPGTYNFWFGVDFPMDGVLNLGGQALYDHVTVVVE